MPQPIPNKQTKIIKPHVMQEFSKDEPSWADAYNASMNPKQTIHFLSIKPSDDNGYEQALKALHGRIVTLATTSQHLIVVTE